MKIKRLSALAVGAVALGLLLDASTAFAEPTVTLDVNNNVISIENLPVAEQAGDVTVYDVEFKYDTALNVYSSSGFNFISEADAILALVAAQEALNNNVPIPPGASAVGNTQFFIGIEVEQNIFVGAVGAENIAGVWDDCQSGCIASAAVGKASDPYTWAFFTLAGQ